MDGGGEMEALAQLFPVAAEKLLDPLGDVLPLAHDGLGILTVAFLGQERCQRRSSGSSHLVAALREHPGSQG
ncbi:hypothetical protein [Streptomyces hawaiiensis]|uniref:hypothetical protein n=1 Tax=Streptomyces hawaiiensis TaxID=67305 RepID=UPI003657A26E